jgi:hypothetical protein
MHLRTVPVFKQLQKLIGTIRQFPESRGKFTFQEYIDLQIIIQAADKVFGGFTECVSFFFRKIEAGMKNETEPVYTKQHYYQQ